MIRFSASISVLLASAASLIAAPTIIRVDPTATRQEFHGMGCGAIFYEAHVTSLAANGRIKEQEALYDDMFSRVHTDILQLQIRHDHEPQNDNDDPYVQAFHDKNFAYCAHPLAIAAAAKKRQPQMKLYAVLYTPPAWMKTNASESGGGKQRGTLTPGSELELAEYIWAFLAHMKKHGQPIDYLSICNEPDWPHDQPSYFLETAAHAALFAKVAEYLRKMEKLHPDVPRPQLVAPNGLSAVDAGKTLLPALQKAADREIDVIGSHDYDRRGNRWALLRELAGTKPLWQTECSFNAVDSSPNLIRSASEYWLFMTEAFNDGVNLWQAYDWVYPPRQGGEALIHLNWGQSYHCTKIYHGFRQWCAPLRPGMKVIRPELNGPAAAGYSQAGVKSSAFLSADSKTLVIHVAAVQDQAADIEIQIAAPFQNATVQQWRTSETENCAVLPKISLTQGSIRQSLPARGLWTLRLSR